VVGQKSLDGLAGEDRMHGVPMCLRFSRFVLGVIRLRGALGGGLEGVFQGGLPDDLAGLR